MNCNFETSTVFCADRTMGTSRRSTNGYASKRACQQPYPRTAPVESPQFSALSGHRRQTQRRACKPRPRTAPRGISTGNTTIGVRNSNCGTSTVFCTSRPENKSCHHNGQDNRIKEQHVSTVRIHQLAPVVVQRRACIDGRRTATAAPHSFLHVRTRTSVQRHNKHVIRVQELQLWDLHGLHCLNAT